MPAFPCTPLMNAPVHAMFQKGLLNNSLSCSSCLLSLAAGVISYHCKVGAGVKFAQQMLSAKIDER